MNKNEWMERPLWLWAILQLQNRSDREISIGEGFVILLDRLEAAGTDIAPVLYDVDQIADALAQYSSFSVEHADHKLRYFSGYVTSFSALLRGRSRDRDNEKLLELSKGIFDALVGAYNWLDAHELNSDLLDGGIECLHQSVQGIIQAMKSDVLDNHPKYYKRDGQLNPAHLGNKVFCIHMLEKIAQQLQPPLGRLLNKAVVWEVPVRTSELRNLLDWDANYETEDHFFWREELNDIMGIGGM
ncbi:hypothetical protein [Paenibacillus sp. GXUN7292]|uniref:hypothetical protein n=1 Tax=Paenibacillus sp. GXUN7292 TaxID=3422499 RepID=UPI003D7E5963